MQIGFPNSDVDAVFVVAFDRTFQRASTKTVLIGFAVPDVVEFLLDRGGQSPIHHAIESICHRRGINRLRKGCLGLANFIRRFVINVGNSDLIRFQVEQGCARIRPEAISR